MVEQNYYKSLKVFIKDEKQQINPKLVLSYKEGDERKNDVCPKGGYEANFVKVNKWSYNDKEGKTINGFEIILDDEVDGEVRLTTAWTNASRFFMNSLCGFTGDKIGKMKISVSADDKFNGKMRANMWLNIDGQPGTSFIKGEERNKYITPVIDPDDKTKILSYKYSKLEALFETKYDEINKKANTLINQIKNETEVKEEPMLKETNKEEDDGLPF